MYQRLEDALADLRTRLGGMPSPDEASDIWTEIWHHEAHHSTAIEGNTLVLSQVRKLLDEGRAVGSKELREYMEVEGYATAARWVYEQAHGLGTWTDGELLTLHEVRSVHHQVMGLVWEVSPHANATPEETPGNWRRHEIQPFGGGMKPPPFTEIDALMRDWVAEVSQLVSADEATPFPERLARMHNDFERIHPFLDGNGRTGRLLLNLVLVRLGYPPAIVFKNDRSRYLTAMERADGGEYGPLGELLARAITDNLHRFIVPAVAGPARLVPLASLAGSDLSLTANALRTAAVRGRLRAQKQPDGTWMSSRNWVDDYLRQRYRRI
ncbi:Fic family protein [Microlunatus speluncae]|uniref:Fic family protein n=1 Tax=Microlunatus speluncae TaxID=2594267 RepID=UPI001FE71ECE|nr:Fic family protein [Microlunatus speluncae]